MTRNADVASTPAPAAASPSGMGPYGAVACAMGGPCFVAVYLGLCLVLFVLVAVLTWTEGLTACLTCPQDTLRLYAYISCAGGLGAVIYCIRGFYKHYSLGDYDRRYAFWYLFRPWIGAVLGMVSYLLIVGGLLAFENGLVAGQNLRTKALFVAVAFLSGFSANEFIMKVNAVAKALFGTETQNAPPGGSGASGRSPDEP